MKNVNREYKSIGINPFEKYYEKLTRLQVRGDAGTISGRVVSVDDKYLLLEHRDGRTTLVKLSQISVISEIPEVV